MEELNKLPIVLFASQQKWRQWLTQNHTQDGGVWLKIAKKNSGKTSVSYAQALDEALCFGWIDGQKQPYDEQYYLQKFTPRRPRSIWSKVNIENVARLSANGSMHPAGLKAVEAAKQDGRWAQAYDSARAMSMPADFQQALDDNPAAKAFFASLNKTNVYAFLWRLQTTKKPANRQAKIEKIIEMLSKGEKLH